MAVRTLDELSALERLSLIEISASRIGTYDMCGLKYFKRYVEKEDGVWGDAAALGSLIHQVMEVAIPRGELNLDLMLEDYKQFRSEHDPENQISQELIDVGITMLQDYVDRHAGETIHLVGVEKSFQIVVGSALISGYIDRLELTSNGPFLIDYKSGKWQVSKPAEDFQLGIYALAAAQWFPGVPIRAGLYYMRPGKLKEHTFTLEDLAKVEERVIDKVDQMINDFAFHPTPVFRFCSFCDFLKNGTCKVGLHRYPKK